jgi:hypothetical protein
VNEIFDTLTYTGENYATAKLKLKEYFAPMKPYHELRTIYFTETFDLMMNVTIYFMNKQRLYKYNLPFIHISYCVYSR